MASQNLTYWVVPVTGWEKMNYYPVTVDSVSEDGETFVYQEVMWDGCKPEKEVQGVTFYFFKTEDEAREKQIQLLQSVVDSYTWKIDQLRREATYLAQFKINKPVL